MKMIYQRRGGPIIRWDQGRAPAASGRAADCKSLGSYEPIPMPGAPEVLSGFEPGNLTTLAVLGGIGYLLYKSRKKISAVVKKVL